MMLKTKLGGATNALKKIMPFMDAVDDPQTSEDLKRTKEEIDKAKSYIETLENNPLPATELDEYLIKNIKIMQQSAL